MCVSEWGGAYGASVRYGCVQGWEESSQYRHYNKLDYTAGSGDLIFLRTACRGEYKYF